jgi:hypothetical protein
MKERACMRNCASGSVNSIPTDNDVLPTVTPEQHAFLEALGFVAAYDTTGKVEFLSSDHLCRCVERGLVHGTSRQ